MARNKKGDALVLTVKEVSELLRIHRPKVYDLIKCGALEGIKIGSDWRVKRSSVEELIGPIPDSFFSAEKVTSSKAA
jgi:excisionase family DNA binding protein